jgi:murein peptide amidase A
MSSEILHQSSWAVSPGGKNIELFSSHRIGDRPLLFIGGVHGDDPEGVELAQKFISWLQKNNNPEFHSWLLIPCLNVDGYSKNERVNGNGVDLNRNFPSHDWSAEAKAPRYFPGSFPGSEPEVQAVCKLISKVNPQVIFHFHSWEPCVVYTGAPGQPWAQLVAGDSGYEVREDIGYPTPGSLGQYAWLNHQIPVICIEEQEHSDLTQVWPRFSKGLQTVLRTA